MLTLRLLWLSNSLIISMFFISIAFCRGDLFNFDSEISLKQKY